MEVLGGERTDSGGLVKIVWFKESFSMTWSAIVNFAKDIFFQFLTNYHLTFWPPSPFFFLFFCIFFIVVFLQEGVTSSSTLFLHPSLSRGHGPKRLSAVFFVSGSFYFLTVFLNVFVLFRLSLSLCLVLLFFFVSVSFYFICPCICIYLFGVWMCLFVFVFTYLFHHLFFYFYSNLHLYQCLLILLHFLICIYLYFYFTLQYFTSLSFQLSLLCLFLSLFLSSYSAFSYLCVFLLSIFFSDQKNLKKHFQSSSHQIGNNAEIWITV